MPGAALPHSALIDRFVVPSPSLYLAPANVTNAELILQALALLLVPAALGEAFMDNKVSGVVREQMMNAWRLWLLWDLDLPLASWRKEIVQWRLTGMLAANQAEEAPLPRGYLEFCALRSVWLPYSTIISIPLTCDERDHAPVYAPPSDALSTAELEQLAANVFVQVSSPVDFMHSTVQPGDTVILTTLMDYVVSRYGREQLPVLLAGLGQYKSWATLSPAVFGVSAAEFAAGWHDYLAAHYSLGEDR
jgi:hypothetical protein